MAWATTRAFANVKSSAMTPRQPSVPNLIAAIRSRGKYTRSDMSAKQPYWHAVVAIEHVAHIREFEHILMAITIRHGRPKNRRRSSLDFVFCRCALACAAAVQTTGKCFRHRPSCGLSEIPECPGGQS